MNTSNVTRALLRMLKKFGLAKESPNKKLELGPALDRLNKIRRKSMRKSNSPPITDDPRIDKFSVECAELSIEKPPTLLYHYTKVDTLSAVTSSKKIWATHILDMRNDSDEFSHGLDLFIEGLTALEKLGIDSVLSNSLKGFIQQEKANPLAAPCVFCFTSIRDGVAQWSEYGNKGNGACLGINTTTLTDAFKNVIYDLNRQREVVDQVVHKFVDFIQDLYRSGTDPNETPYVRALALAYFRIAYMQAIRFKKPTFDHEQEWRVVGLLGNAQLVSRQGESPSGVIRYTTIDIDLKAIAEEIVLGPNVSGEDLNILLEQYADVEKVVKSSLEPIY